MPRILAPVSGPDKTYIPETALTLGYAVTVGATQGNCAQVSAAGQRVIGVSNGTVPAGKPARITRLGECVAIGGGQIAHGQYVKANAAGKFVPVAGAAGSGEEVAGRAESDTAADGDEFVLFVSPFVL